MVRKDYNKIIKYIKKNLKKDIKEGIGFPIVGTANGIENIRIDGEIWQIQFKLTREFEEFLPFMKKFA